MLSRWSDFGFGTLDFAAFDDLRREMDRLFSDFERGYGADAPRPFAALRGSRAAGPRFGLSDSGSAFRLWAEVPGLSEKDFDILVEQSTLTIRAQRAVSAPEGYSVHRQERGALAFARSFTLPARVDADKVSAKLQNGILEVSLPKVAAEQPRQIQVKAS